MPLDRRHFVTALSCLGLTTSGFPAALLAAVEQTQGSDPVITVETVAHAEKVSGLHFTAEQRAKLVEDLNERLKSYDALRSVSLTNSTPPAFCFELAAGGGSVPAGKGSGLAKWRPRSPIKVTSKEDLAFATLEELSALLRNREVTSTELTELSLERLKHFDPVLKTVVTLTEERARKQAAEADKELRAGHWRGPLHGIPWGAKDLLAVAGYPTTWGALPFQDQHFDYDAEVVRRLDAAGAVLVAKLSLGALALNDTWFGGQTKCPWNPETGSSGSSAGPAAAVAAGLVPFAIGSETRGSIVSPCTKNGVTGLRPTFGRISRHGAMALCWSMDKIGPIARSAADCVLVFSAIHGHDPKDFSSKDAPFSWPQDLRQIRVGYYEEAFAGDYDNRDSNLKSLDLLRNLGVKLVPVKLPKLPGHALDIILEAEAAAAFDDLTRSGDVDNLIAVGQSNWSESFRSARFISAVEYIQANRIRTQVMRETESALVEIDVLVTPSFRSGILALTNVTGHPVVVAPDGFLPVKEKPDSKWRTPSSLSFVGKLYQDERCLAVADQFQQVTGFHRERPPIGR